MAQEQWRNARLERGKPRVYIQQFLEVSLPEADYLAALTELRGGRQPSDPFADDNGILVLEAMLEDLDDGSQCDTVHVHRQEGNVLLMTVISYAYTQATFDRLRAQHLAAKVLATGGLSGSDGSKDPD